MAVEVADLGCEACRQHQDPPALEDGCSSPRQQMGLRDLCHLRFVSPLTGILLLAFQQRLGQSISQHPR